VTGVLVEIVGDSTCISQSEELGVITNTEGLDIVDLLSAVAENLLKVFTVARRHAIEIGAINIQYAGQRPDIQPFYHQLRTSALQTPGHCPGIQSADSTGIESPASGLKDGSPVLATAAELQVGLTQFCEAFART